MKMVTIGNTKFPFDEELFALNFENQPDLVKNAMVNSGAMVIDDYVASLIANGGNYYTVPFYNTLADEEQDNYDGATDMSVSDASGAAQSGVVYGRMKAWRAPQFAADITKADPMGAIAAGIAPYYTKQRQKRLVGITNAVLSLDEMKSHCVTKKALTENTLSDVSQEIWGDAKDNITLAVMHSSVAQVFEDLSRAQYLRYTDATGMTREVRTITVNGILCVIDDTVGKNTAAPSGRGGENAAATYDTYLFGAGAIRYANAPVNNPVEVWRDAVKFGGIDFIGTRVRETIHPNGFTFKKPANMTNSPTNAQLFDKSNWQLAYKDPRAVFIGKVTTPAANAQ